MSVFSLKHHPPSRIKISKIFIIVFYRNDCIEKKDSPEVFFCCCEGNMCNERFYYFPEMEVTQRKLVWCICERTAFLSSEIFNSVYVEEIRIFHCGVSFLPEGFRFIHDSAVCIHIKNLENCQFVSSILNSLCTRSSLYW